MTTALDVGDSGTRRRPGASSASGGWDMADQPTDAPIDDATDPDTGKKKKSRTWTAAALAAIRMGNDATGTVVAGFVQALILAYVLAMYATNIGTIVYPKVGLNVAWLVPQDTFWGLRGRWGLLYVMTFLEFIYFIPPQAFLVMLITGRRWMAVTKVARIVAVFTCWVAVAFAVVKFVVFLGALAWCFGVPECTDEAIVNTSGRGVYFARVAETLILGLMFTLDVRMIGPIYARYRKGQEYATAQAGKRDVVRQIAKDARNEALADMAIVAVQIVILAIAFVMLALVATSVVFPKTGLTVGWLTAPGSYGWIRDRWGAQHVLLLMEILYLVGPQAVILFCAAGYKSIGAAMLYAATAHAFLVVAIIYSFFRIIEFALMTGSPELWPETTTEVVGSTATSKLFIARFVIQGIFFVGYIADELLLVTVQRRYKQSSDERRSSRQATAAAYRRSELLTTRPGPDVQLPPPTLARTPSAY